MAADAVAIAADEAMIQAEAAAIFWKGRRKDDFEQANKTARALLPASPRQEMHRAKWHAEQGDTETAIRRLEALEARTPKTAYLPLDSVSSTQNAAPGRMPPDTSAPR